MVKRYVISKVDLASIFLGLDLPYFIKGGFWLGISITATTLGGILLSSLFATVWPKDVYGQYSFLTAALGFLSLISLPGMGQAIVQAVSEGKEGTYAYATKIIFKMSVIGTFILVLGSIYFYFRENQNLALAVLAAALAFPFTSTFKLFTSYLNGKREFKRIAVYSGLVQLLTIGSTTIALLKFPSLIFVTLAATWSSAIIYSIFGLQTFLKTQNRIVDLSLIKLGKALSLTNVMTLAVDYFDRFAIPFFLGFTQNAVYTIAILIPVQLLNFLKISTSLAQPKLVSIKEKEAKKVLIFKSLQLEIPIIIITFFYIITAPFIFQILYPDYQEAVFLSQIFSLILLYYPSNLFGLYLVKKRAMGKALLSSVIYMIASISSLLIFLWLWGLIGVVFSKLFTKIIQVLTTQLFFNSELANAKTKHKI